MSFAERFPWVATDSPAASYWRELQESGGRLRLARFERMLEGNAPNSGPPDLDGVPLSELDLGELLVRRFRLPDGTMVTEETEGVYRIEGEEES